VLDALSDERTGLSFAISAGPRQNIYSRVRVSWDSRQYFTVPDLRLPFLSSPTTRKVTVELFDLTPTRDLILAPIVFKITPRHGPHREPLLFLQLRVTTQLPNELQHSYTENTASIVVCWNVFTELLPGNNHVLLSRV
jgi:hypothetical protein